MKLSQINKVNTFITEKLQPLLNGEIWSNVKDVSLEFLTEFKDKISLMEKYTGKLSNIL